MSYKDFTLSQLRKNFGLTIHDDQILFPKVFSNLQLEPAFQAYLEYNIALALRINTEKARSEMMIAPLLVELRRLLRDRISLFSGIEFNVDVSKGLNGFCDFLLSKSPQQLYLQAPVAVLVEAKNENIKGGLAQCLAAMLAAQIFNQQEGVEIPVIYGAVTTGNQWKFLKLDQTEAWVDLQDYYIDQPQVILNILSDITNGSPN
jgi:hypothetical protein